jgi:hypothetical protein
LNWIFTACVACKKSSSNLEKNPVHQTQNFKLENVKNQVQIDRGYGFFGQSTMAHSISAQNNQEGRECNKAKEY